MAGQNNFDSLHSLGNTGMHAYRQPLWWANISSYVCSAISSVDSRTVTINHLAGEKVFGKVAAGVILHSNCVKTRTQETPDGWCHPTVRKLDYTTKFNFHTQTRASVINAEIIRSFVVVKLAIELKQFSFHDFENDAKVATYRYRLTSQRST